MSINLPRFDREDRVVWTGNKDRLYTVKKGCLWVKSQNPPSIKKGPSPSRHLDCQIWKEIWKLKVPSQIKFFLWKVIKGALLTQESVA